MIYPIQEYLDYQPMDSGSIFPDVPGKTLKIFSQKGEFFVDTETSLWAIIKRWFLTLFKIRDYSIDSQLTLERENHSHLGKPQWKGPLVDKVKLIELTSARRELLKRLFEKALFPHFLKNYQNGDIQAACSHTFQMEWEIENEAEKIRPQLSTYFDLGGCFLIFNNQGKILLLSQTEASSFPLYLWINKSFSIGSKTIDWKDLPSTKIDCYQLVINNDNKFHYEYDPNFQPESTQLRLGNINQANVEQITARLNAFLPAVQKKFKDDWLEGFSDTPLREITKFL